MHAHMAGTGGVVCAGVAVPNKVSAFSDDEDAASGAAHDPGDDSDNGARKRGPKTNICSPGSDPGSRTR
jgi:hypothetical protein